MIPVIIKNAFDNDGEFVLSEGATNK